MRFLHTADWHLGQTFYEYDRTNEHLAFFEWLKNTIEKKQIDVLLVAGDIFDTANPSAHTIRLFYDFINHISKKHPKLQAFFIAGNHDSAIRLETPIPLLTETNIHLIGQVRKTAQHAIDYEQLIYPIQQNQETIAYCLAVPFLRLGDYPKSQHGGYNYIEGIERFYQEILDKAEEIAQGKPIISMGHLHASGVDYATNNTAERAIMGGIEGLNVSQLAQKADYWAFGHIHKPQAVAGIPHVRYSGSPIPLSFSEINYTHQVVTFDIIDNHLQNIEEILIPVSVPLLNIPETGHKDFAYILQEITRLPDKNRDDNVDYPYLQVRVLMEKPNPEMKVKLQEALATKAVRLAKIDARLRSTLVSKSSEKETDFIDLQNITPKDVLSKSFEKKYHEPLPENYETMLEEILAHINQKKNQH